MGELLVWADVIEYYRESLLRHYRSMYVHYFYWQYVAGPRWLLRLAFNVQRMLFQLFSVKFMLRTLVAHWRKDAVSYRQGSFTGMLKAWAWNMISRAVGFIIRLVVLVGWVVTEGLFWPLAAVVLLLFLLWPALVLVGAATGIVFVLTGF